METESRCDAATDKLIRRIPWSLTTSTPGVQRTIKKLEFNAAGSQLEVSSNGENDLVFDVSSGQLVATLTSTQQGKFSRDGTAFVGGNGKHLIAWSTKDWSKVSDAPSGPATSRKLQLSPRKISRLYGALIRRALFILVREKKLQRWDRGTRILPHSIKTGLWFLPTRVAASVFGIPVENKLATRKVSVWHHRSEF
jgi:hypothetical protein